MLLVDKRAGSKDLYAPLKGLGLDAELTELAFGDVAFEGRGIDGAKLDIGIEFKQLEELITSIRDGRFAGHQLPGMLAMYDYSWLLIEGQWKSNPKGQIVTLHRHNWRPIHANMTASEFDKHLLTFQLCGGIHVTTTPTRHDTLRFLAGLYHWWTDSALDSHTSHLAIHRPPSFLPISKFRQFITGLPDVGLKTSRAIEEHFKGSPRKAINAGAREWAEIQTTDKQGKTKRIGSKVAEQIVNFCEGKT